MIVTNRRTPTIITGLEPTEFFVFGSNLAGTHGGGAAKQAHEDFSAEWGVGEGLTGKCYAFPTLDENYEQLSINTLSSVREAFYRCARAHGDYTFLLTKVGCGIAGYPEEDMAMLFRDAPINVLKPEGW